MLALIMPQADAPPACWATITGPSTRNAQEPRFHTAWPHRAIQYQDRAAISRQPTRRSARRLVRSRGDPGGSLSMPSATALIRKVAASRRYTQPTEAVATAIPAISGPMICAVLREMSINALACWSRGVLTVWGTIPVNAGLATAAAAP
jgi:hypothetical protein